MPQTGPRKSPVTDLRIAAFPETSNAAATVIPLETATRLPLIVTSIDSGMIPALHHAPRKVWQNRNR